MTDRESAGGIIVGVDGSHGSDGAVRWAAREAAMRKATLTLVHMLHFPSEGWGSWGVTMAPLPEDFSVWQEEGGRRVIADARRVASEAVAGVTVRGEVTHSPPASTLIDLSKDAQMVVVGCRGQGAVKRVLLGSVSSALVQRAHCPVAIIHDEFTDAPGSNAPVLVGIDGSRASEVATSIAFDEASRRGVELVALHAWSDGDWPQYPGIDWSDVTAKAEATLAERLGAWQERYPDVVVRRLVVLDQPARHLLEESESSQLVVVGSHGRGGLAGAVLGSVSTAVAHGAHTPVIVAGQG